MKSSFILWRVGHRTDPYRYVPHRFCSWNHRFDDLRRRYRTLYWAPDPLTCLREVLADFRSNTKRIAEFQRLFPGAALPAGIVPEAWRDKKALVEVEVRTPHDEFADLDDLSLRRKLEEEHAELLARHGMRHLNISEIRSKNREVTRTISGWLYDEGYAGVLFKSNYDDLPCYAFFEGRVDYVPTSTDPIPLDDKCPQLMQVCREYHLRLS